MNKQTLEKMLYKENKTQREIARIYRCSESLVSQKIKKYGLRRKTEDAYLGKKFNSLKPIKYLGKDKNSHTIFLCVCDCGKTKEVLANSLTNGNTKSCGCTSRKRGKEHKLYAGYEEIRAEYWSRVLRGAKDRNIEVKITIEDAWEVFLKQDKKCSLTGEILHFPHTRKTRKYSTASLDRIDSSAGYTKDNIQWIHKKLQPMKMNLSQEEFIKTCRMVYLYNRSKIK